jgi:RHS repeat-associated protein
MSRFHLHRRLYLLSSGENEVYLYGSNRLGSLTVHRNAEVAFQVWDSIYYIGLSGHAVKSPFVRSNKQYKLTNHLANVMVTISDKKSFVSTTGIPDHFIADVVTANDYYPFGMQQPGRKFSAGSGYRYGFNGKEKSDEVYGDGNAYDYGFRIYNPRLGRFLSVDPLTKGYSSLTPYQFSSNNPVCYIDLDGLESIDPIEVIQQPKSKGEPGLAYTTARKVYLVVTKGIGALTESEQGEINPEAIKQQLNSTPQEPAFYTDLPTAQTGGYPAYVTQEMYNNLFSQNQRKKNNALANIREPFYAVIVDYDISIRIEKDVSLEDAAEMVIRDPSHFGIMFNYVSSRELAKLNLPSSAIADLIRDAKKQFDGNYGSANGEAQAYGSVRSPINRAGLDLIIFNTELVNGVQMSMTDRVVHEMGHNFTNNVHDKDYSYDQRGQQSNENGKIVPTGTNKYDTIKSGKIEDIYDKVIVLDKNKNGT